MYFKGFKLKQYDYLRTLALTEFLVKQKWAEINRLTAESVISNPDRYTVSTQDVIGDYIHNLLPWVKKSQEEEKTEELASLIQLLDAITETK